MVLLQRGFKIPLDLELTPRFILALNASDIYPLLLREVLYLKIKDVVELTGTAADTLRYYEKIGLLQIERKNGVRSFSEENLKQIYMILQLKEAGFLLKEIVFLYTLDDAIQSPMCLSLKDEQVLTDVKDLVFTKLNLTREKIIRMQESVTILEKMHSKLVDALKSGKMEGYTK